MFDRSHTSSHSSSDSDLESNADIDQHSEVVYQIMALKTHHWWFVQQDSNSFDTIFDAIGWTVM